MSLFFLIFIVGFGESKAGIHWNQSQSPPRKMPSSEETGAPPSASGIPFHSLSLTCPTSLQHGYCIWTFCLMFVHSVLPLHGHWYQPCIKMGFFFQFVTHHLSLSTARSYLWSQRPLLFWGWTSSRCSVNPSSPNTYKSIFNKNETIPGFSFSLLYQIYS